MNLPPFVERNRRAFALLVGGLVCWAAFKYGVKPYLNALNGAKQSYAAERMLLIKERDAVATAQRNPLLQQLTDSVMKAMEPRLFDGHDDAIATSDLGSYLRDVAADNKVWLNFTTGPSNVLTDGVRILRVNVKAESDFQGILSFLKALERGDHLVRVERLDITRTQRGSGALTTATDFETIAMQAVISGYAMGELSAPPPATVGAARPGGAPATGAARPAPLLPKSTP